jgi:cell division protein ZapA (FtsZ GTPase activity inhibitor)
MSKETIEIKIAGRSYPLSVLPKEVEDVKDAASAIDDRLTELKSKFAVQDRIDLFAMTALQLSIRVKQLENLEVQITSEKDSKEETATLELIDDLIKRMNSAMER